MSDLALTSGAKTTNGVVRTGMGKLTYFEASIGAVALYDGLTTGGLLIANITTGSTLGVGDRHRAFTTPVKFNDGLYVTIGSGNAVIHMA